MSVLLAALAHARSTLAGERKARATCSPAALQAHFAAVMGNALREHLIESGSWSVQTDVQDDPNLQKAVATLRRKILKRDRSAVEDLEHLFTGLESHVRWQLNTASKSLAGVLAALSDPEEPLLPDPSATGAGGTDPAGTGRVDGVAVRSEAKVSVSSLNTRFELQTG